MQDHAQTHAATETRQMPLAAPGQKDNPGLFLVSALRLFACPCAAPVHETLRAGSPAAKLLDVMREIDAHARRPLRLHPTPCPEISRDEEAFLGLIACAQAEDEALLSMRCCTLVRPAGQSSLVDRVRRLARALAADGIRLPAPPPSRPVCARPLGLVRA